MFADDSPFNPVPDSEETNMSNRLDQCPKCAASFPEPLPESAACPRCGVYFFKLATSAAAPAAVSAETAASRTQGSSAGRWILAVALAGVLAAWFRQAPTEGSPAPPSLENSGPELSVERQSPAGPSPQPVIAKRAAPAPNTVDPEMLQLHATADTVFDMRDEVYRIANLNGITLASIQFHGSEPGLPGGDGTGASAVAFAQPSLQNGQRVCDVRVIRPTGDLAYQPGQPTTQLVNLIRRTTIAHELAHCVDWYNGGVGLVRHGPNLPPSRDALAAADVVRRWREEFADLHAMILLKRALGEDTARLALKARALDRKSHPMLWYRHAYVPLSSGEALATETVEDTERLIAKYWGQ